MNLIHIGLPKNGSTSLQANWSQNKSISYISEQLSPVITSTRKAAIDSSNPNELLSLWPDNIDKKTINIYSSEGLSGLPWGYKAQPEEYDYSQYLFANICKEMITNAKILILVRTPERWIRSVYAQTIQEGSNLGFGRFLRKQRNYLLSGLNISKLNRHWSDVYSPENVVLYPFERLANEPKLANNELSQLFNVPAEMGLFTIEKQANKSLSDDNIRLLRAMSILNRRIEGSNSLLKNSFKKLNEDMRLLYRVQLQKQGRDFSALTKLIAPIEYSLPRSEVASFKQTLIEGFLSELNKPNDFYGMLDIYKMSIQTLCGETTAK